MLPDLHDGTYQLSYLVTVVGRYSLAVSVDCRDIEGSPHRIRVEGGFHFPT